MYRENELVIMQILAVNGEFTQAYILLLLFTLITLVVSIIAA